MFCIEGMGRIATAKKSPMRMHVKILCPGLRKKTDKNQNCLRRVGHRSIYLRNQVFTVIVTRRLAQRSNNYSFSFLSD